ncbi:hypothetical protein ACN47A_00990 [Myxococcus fulvus]|uniref:hypothetical protein n=1 Tax=Myxococcus fulvus TaxID=33 RepID=UPI003B99172C
MNASMSAAGQLVGARGVKTITCRCPKYALPWLVTWMFLSAPWRVTTFSRSASVVEVPNSPIPFRWTTTG